MNLDRATEQKNERETVFAGLHAERAEIEEQLAELENNKAQIAAEIEAAAVREKEIGQENEDFQKRFEEYQTKEKEAAETVSKIALEAVSYTHLDVYKRQRQGMGGKYERFSSKLRKFFTEISAHRF